MSALDLIAFATTALAGHRLRSALSLLGVAIGVAAVVLLTALGEAARAYVVGQFEALGTNLLIVIPGRTETSGGLPGVGKPPHDLTLGDAEALRRGIAQARHVVPVVIGTERVAHQGRQRDAIIVGTTHEFLAVRRLGVGIGGFLPPLEQRRSLPVVVLGSKLAAELFPGQNPLGRIVRIGGWRMRTIGVLVPRGVQLGLNLDEIALVPVGTGMRMFDRTSLFRILIELGAHTELEAARERARAIIRERHGEEDVTCLSQDAVLGAFSSILGALTAALAGIALVSLSVAGIGIMNVMLVSVSERTAEIGLLKALGARRRQVLAAFLAEAVLLALAGGVLGLLAAAGAGQAVSWYVPALQIRPPAWAVAAALGLSVGAGALFGLLPALRAVRLDPVAALARAGG
ncbi:MAG: ABC transporter permease [Planctomycetota bacterium]|nr:MAG: ABC transporter permease [Planctomycetota bacterium]